MPYPLLHHTALAPSPPTVATPPALGIPQPIPTATAETTLSGTVHLRLQQTNSGTGTPPAAPAASSNASPDRELIGTYALRAPDRFRLQLHDKAGKPRSATVADGKHLWLLTYPSPNPPGQGQTPRLPMYRKIELSGANQASTDPRRTPLWAALRQSGVIGEEFALYLASGSSRAALENYLKEEGFGELSPGPAAPAIDNLPVETRVATLTAAGGTTRTITLAFTKPDGRLRQVTSQTRLPEGRILTRVETHHDLKVNVPLPDSVFTFAPPPDAVAIAPAPRPHPTLAPVSALAGDYRPTPEEAGRFTAAPPRSARPGSRPPENTSTAPPTAPRATPVTPVNPLTMPTTPAPRPAGSLRVVETPGVTLSTLDQARAAFEPVSLLDKTQVEQTFTLKNEGKNPLTIARLLASCGCLSAVVQTPGKTPAPHGALATLAPGESVQIAARIQFVGLRPGPLAKTVHVFTADNPQQPALSLTLQGVLLPVVRFSADSLAFGTVPAGQETHRELTVTPDPRLREGKVPPLRSLVPGVTVTALPADDAPGNPANPPGTRRYRISITPDAPLGPLSGLLAFQPDPATATAPTTAPTAPTDNRAAAWRSATLPVSAEVVGAVRAVPALLAFGAVTTPPARTAPDTAAPRSVALMERSPGALADATLSVSSPHLTARLKSEGEGTVLEVAVRASAPAGPLQGSVTVQLKNGQRLPVPISAYVTPGRPEGKKP